MMTSLKEHSETLANIYDKVAEITTDLEIISRKIEQDISNTPTGDFRNTLTEINIMLNDVIYNNFK